MKKKLNLNGIGMTSLRTRSRLVSQLKELGIRNPDVLDVILNTPRHIFVDEALSHRAYENTALPIGHNQTISQPYIVARMTELLLLDNKPSKVLEVGTGCGYQTAVLAQLVDEVYTVERIRALQDQARKRFRTLDLYNIRTQHSDGQWGWESRAPFDSIIVTAAPKTVPDTLLAQLKNGGRLVIPVGGSMGQKLQVLTRRDNRIERQEIEAVSFVPLLGGEV